MFTSLKIKHGMYMNICPVGWFFSQAIHQNIQSSTWYWSADQKKKKKLGIGATSLGIFIRTEDPCRS